MKRIPIALGLLILSPCVCRAQVSGNSAFTQPGGMSRAEQNEKSRRILTRDEMPLKADSMYLDASVLMNVKADEYVAVFGVMQEGATVDECQKKMNDAIQAYTGKLKALGVESSDIFVDYIAQNRVYGFDVTSDIAREKLTGFEIKKNVSIHYMDYAFLDKFVSAAAQLQIYDLIKVDYLLKNTQAINARLMNEAMLILKHKADRYEKLLNQRIKPVQVVADKPGIYYPTDMYNSYNAFETEDVNTGYYRQKYVVQSVRKSRTFYYNGLTSDGFDLVINPVIIEPKIQCTLYLKTRYEPVTAVKAPVVRGARKR